MKKTIHKIASETKKHKSAAKVIVIVLSIVLVGGILLLPKEKEAEAEPLITYSTKTPDESKTNADNYNWRGAPDEPKKIRISKINVDAFIQKAGIDQENKVAVPTNVHLAGWFAESQKPGQNGLSIISGHVSGQTVDGGVFKQLEQLKNGDEFEVEMGNGDVKRYKVIDTKKVKENESANYLFSQNPKVKSQVNLITCAGNFNSDTQLYDERVIVSGELK